MAVFEPSVTKALAQIPPCLDFCTQGVGGTANVVKSTLFGLFTLHLYPTAMGPSGTLVDIASIVVLVWDAATDPCIGYFSDRVRFCFGRRHTFMFIGALVMGISFCVP